MTEIPAEANPPEKRSRGKKSDFVTKLNTSLKNWQNIISLFAVFAALIAVGISIKSCRQADASYEIAKEEFLSKRFLILKGTIEKDNNDEMKISSVDNSIAIQSVVVLTPFGFNESIPVTSPNYSMSLFQLRNSIQERISQKVSAEKDIPKVAFNKTVPVVLLSNYTTQGQSYRDFSLYHILFDVVIRENEKPSITFKGIGFSRRINSDVDINKTLNEEFTVEFDNKILKDLEPKF